MRKPPRSPRPELVRLRQAAGLTQQQLADALGLQSARPVKAWERGTYAPSISLALPLARALGVSVEEVVIAISGPDREPAQQGAAGGEPARGWTPPAGAPGAVPAPMDVPSETLAALAYHVAALSKLVRRVERTATMAQSVPDADVGCDTAPSSASPLESAPHGGGHDP